jgi:hypothetical protein
MSTTIGSSSPASATVAASLNATAADLEAEEYRKGRGEGIVWACEYATSDELRDLVEKYERGRGGDFDNPHWRGFVAGAEEVLDAVGPLRLIG